MSQRTIEIGLPEGSESVVGVFPALTTEIVQANQASQRDGAGHEVNPGHKVYIDELVKDGKVAVILKGEWSEQEVQDLTALVVERFRTALAAEPNKQE